jgi:hypothetical protein
LSYKMKRILIDSSGSLFFQSCHQITQGLKTS